MIPVAFFAPTPEVTMPSKPSKKLKALRAAVMERAGFRCEGTPLSPHCRLEHGLPHGKKGKRAILRLTHLDQDPDNTDPSNLRMLCGRCRTAWDQRFRELSAAAARHRSNGQIELFGARP
ncbi:hypothetical protein OPKNFCMD_4521 [Methylobacterium crusticola]|uniref:HNH endonuclease n=1 Tax=Methylobacterium crusticola TaxID=1697972 RepID=A0ABQ4R2C1_9HYPH|nr:hypothetical protein [Methylobacterium crusticola]GJD51763.1 hypothetical protein OPKNFCMD_4521 [Methylobacterium crusticola]